MAAGEPLPFRQEDITCTGHAIEAPGVPRGPGNLHARRRPHHRPSSACGRECSRRYRALRRLHCWVRLRASHGQSHGLGRGPGKGDQSAAGGPSGVPATGCEVECSAVADILASKEFRNAAYHTGSVPMWVDRLQSHSHHSSTTGGAHRNGNSNGPKNGHEKSEKEMAAAIGVAMAMAMRSAPSTAAASPWRISGRREQLLSALWGAAVGGN